MLLDNLEKLKKAKGLTVKQIATQANLSEEAVARRFSGDNKQKRQRQRKDNVKR